VGRAVAAPILFDAFARRGRSPPPLAAAPKGVIFAATPKLPLPLQRFRPNGLPGEGGAPPLKILYPPDGARLELAADGDAKPGPLALKIAGGAQPLTVLVNGMPTPVQSGSRTLFFEPDGPGFLRLTVMDAKGAADSVMVRVQ
jgi:penicillin-binding protein 1C